MKAAARRARQGKPRAEAAAVLLGESDDYDASRGTVLGQRLRGKVATAVLVGISPPAVEACGRDGLCTVYVERMTGRRLYIAEDVATAVALRKAAVMDDAAHSSRGYGQRDMPD